MLSGEVSFGSACACRPVAIELGLVEQSLPHIEQGGIGAASGQRRVEAAMGVHPLRVDSVARQRQRHAEHVVSGDQARLPVGVAMTNRFTDGESFDLTTGPGEIGEVLGRQRRDSKS